MNWIIVSAQFMVIAVGARLLMIAGEFDLSVGSMIGFSGMVMAILVVHFGWPLWLSIIITFFCVFLGGVNGFLVIKTGLPSFIVTLSFLYILRGLTIWGAILFTRKTIIPGVTETAQGDLLAALFGGKILGSLFSWMGEVGLIAAFTRGNRAGQPVSAASDRGLLKKFEAIICVVIGGALLTGGYGSVIGTALGAIIFGVVQQGLFFANAESALFRVFLGLILLTAVIMNT